MWIYIKFNSTLILNKIAWLLNELYYMLLKIDDNNYECYYYCLKIEKYIYIYLQF